MFGMPPKNDVFFTADSWDKYIIFGGHPKQIFGSSYFLRALEYFLIIPSVCDTYFSNLDNLVQNFLWSKLLGSDSILNPDNLKAHNQVISHFLKKTNTKPNFVNQGPKIYYLLTNHSTAPQSPRIRPELTW